MAHENDQEQEHDYLGYIREGVAQEGFTRSLPETGTPNRHHQNAHNNIYGASPAYSNQASPALSHTTSSFLQVHSDVGARHPMHNGVGSGRGSSVSIDHFDPIGVHELRRTMSHMSQDPDRSLEQPRLDDKERSKSGPAVISNVPVRSTDGSSLDSGATLNTNSGEGAFDFEKSLRYHTKK